MPKSVLLAIFIIFIIHFAIFLRLSLLRKKCHHMLATASFLSLIMFSSIRLWAPRMMLWGHPLHNYFRFCAWCTSATTLLVYVRNRGKSLKQ